MDKVTQIIVQDNKLVLKLERTVPLNLFNTTEKRFQWLQKLGYTKVFPTWSGYAYVYDPRNKLWYRTDLQNKIVTKNNLNQEKQLKHIPKDVLISKALPPETELTWDGSIDQIPIIIKQEGL